jgi:hypothetical protein
MGKRITKASQSEPSIEELILYGIYSVRKAKETCTFERLVAACFEKFPKVFGFRRYPHWPDALKFDRPLRKLREKGLIVGESRQYFELTQFGEEKAKEIEKIIKTDGIPSLNKLPSTRSNEDRLINYVKNHPLFKSYLANPADFSFSGDSFRNLLMCTLETPIRILKQNLAYFKKLAKSYNEEEIIQFLKVCEEKFIKEAEKGAKGDSY